MAIVLRDVVEVIWTATTEPVPMIVCSICHYVYMVALGDSVKQKLREVQYHCQQAHFAGIVWR